MADQKQIEILKQGVNAWDEWREQNLDVRIDLSRADLNSAKLSRANLAFADLTHADLAHADLTHADLAHADLSSAKLREAKLYGANFRDAKFLGADLWNAKLQEADLKDAIFCAAELGFAILRDANLRGANLRDAKFILADLSRADLSNTILCKAVLKDAKLIGANLSNTDLSNTDLSGADLSGLNFSGANLSNTILHRANINNTDLSGANLRKTDLRGLNFSGVNLRKTDLSGLNFSDANLSGVSLRNIDLRNTNLSGANLNRADLSNANLSGADLSGLNFSDANLSNTNLSRANLSNANLNGADLSNAKLTSVNLYRIQALKTDFSLSDLSGACIQEWYINSETKFESAKCKYIYRKYRDKEFFDRLPVNFEQEFKPGEFELWIKVLDHARQTIDLTFTDGIDWQAFFESLQGVRQEYPDADVGLQAIEEKGTAFVIRLKTTPEADLSAIESTQKELYETRLQLRESQGENRVLREMNQVLERLAGTAMNKPTHQTTIHAQNIGAQHSGSGNITGFSQTIGTEGRQTPAESAKEIQDLLIQLKSANPTDIQAALEERIKGDPTLRDRLQNALREGGLETMKVIFPTAGIAIETVRGWVDAEGDE